MGERAAWRGVGKEGEGEDASDALLLCLLGSPIPTSRLLEQKGGGAAAMGREDFVIDFPFFAEVPVTSPVISTQRVQK